MASDAAVDDMQRSPLPMKLTLSNVYELGKEIAREMQRASAEHGNDMTSFKGVVERVVMALEWLETYVEEAEELRTANYRLLLKADELVREKARRSTIEHDLKGMQLVAEERGRQRDTLAFRVAELEAQNTQFYEKIEDFEQNKSLMLRRERYSGTIIEQYEAVDTASNPDYTSRTKSLDRRELKFKKGSKQSCSLAQLQRELNNERKKVTEMRESRALEQRRIQQRLQHMEQEISNLTKQLTTSQLLIEKLNKEKYSLLERSEVITEVKAITLATIARGNIHHHDSGQHSFEQTVESSPKFYKKDLLIILKDRNELKEKVSILQDKLTLVKRKLSQYESVTPIHSRGHSPVNFMRRSNTCTPTFNGCITERLVDSMVILDVSNHLQLPPDLQASVSPPESSGSSQSIDRTSEHNLVTSNKQEKSIELSTSL